MFNARMVKDLEAEMERIGVTNEGIEIMLNKGEFYKIRIDEVPLKGAIILKQEALAAGMECALPWCTASLSCEKTPAILFGTKRQFEILISKMKRQPFKGSIIAEELENCIKNMNKEYEISLPSGTVSLEPYKIMGILNVTPDSFSDGGKFNRVDAAVERAHEMIEEGAHIIDVGGESSRPFSEPVSEEEELKRVLPVLEELEGIKVPVSIDTYKPKVAEEALKRGASIVNDIYGLRSDGMAEVVKEYDAAVVIMHMKGQPKDMQLNPNYSDVVGEISSFFNERVEFARKKGIDDKKIILDPGIGFGKRVEDNLMLLKSLEGFKCAGYPLLVGVSRKSYIGKVLNADVNDRLIGTVVSNAIALINGAKIFRVHDVMENAQALKIANEIWGAFA